MTWTLALQEALVGLAVAGSAWVVMRSQFPGATRRLRAALAIALLRPTRPAWLRGLGRRVAPAALAGGQGCAGCDHCGPPPAKR